MKLADKEKLDELALELDSARHVLSNARQSRDKGATKAKTAYYVGSTDIYTRGIRIDGDEVPIEDAIRAAERNVRRILDKLGNLGVDVSGEAV